MAPTKAERRAFSPFSSVVPSSKICVGLKEAMVLRLGAPKSRVCGFSRDCLTSLKARLKAALIFEAPQLSWTFVWIDAENCDNLKIKYKK